MQSKEKDNSIAFGLAIVAFIGIAFITLIGFVVVVLSIVCIFAWNKPVRFMGETITPELARGFVGCGVIGAIIGLAVANHSGGGEARQYFPLVGYMIGALGFALHHHLESEAQKNEEAEVLPPLRTPSAEQPPQPPRPFTFASWDDEEMH